MERLRRVGHMSKCPVVSHEWYGRVVPIAKSFATVKHQRYTVLVAAQCDTLQM